MSPHVVSRLLDARSAAWPSVARRSLGDASGRRRRSTRSPPGSTSRCASPSPESVKAGKSTLLNALVGEELAPTDAGECTRIVTWYRDGHTSRVDAAPAQRRRTRQATFARADGALLVDLGNEAADEVERIDVQWPSKRLAGMTLIDTPGLGSANEGGSAPTRGSSPSTTTATTARARPMR